MGVLLGAALFWGISLHLKIEPPSQSSPETSANKTCLDYYGDAVAVAELIRDGDYAALAGWVGASEGLYIVPFSTVDFEKNLKFTASQVSAFGEDKTAYLWGVNPDSGKLIEMTPSDFFAEFLRTRDYSTAEIIGNNKVVRKGNAVENAVEAFPDSYFVDLFFSSTDPTLTDWSSLKLVFKDDGSGVQRLTAIIHSVNTLQ